ncbi:hypothetical protein HK104_006956 [Borealophlyctis nickersoniae]|nr:hypothetical protein HK104_006956 [Borealophlyctis nickersoniae]
MSTKNSKENNNPPQQQRSALEQDLLVAYLGIVRLLIDQDAIALETVVRTLSGSRVDDTPEPDEVDDDDLTPHDDKKDASNPSIEQPKPEPAPKEAFWSSLFARKDKREDPAAHPAVVAFRKWGDRTMEGLFHFNKFAPQGNGMRCA